MKGNKNTGYKSHWIVFSFITIALIVLTIIGGIGDAAEYRENLDIAGVKQALNGSTLVVILAGITLIISVVYLFSSWRARRHLRKELTAMAMRAREAQARGEEYTIEAPPIGRRVGSALSKGLDAVTKILILLFVLALIVIGGLSSIKENEFRNRPVFSLIDQVEISQAITGYDSLGYIDPDLVDYGIPDDITEILETGKNYKKSKDYSDQQKLWDKVKEDISFEISPDTSDIGVLSNGDTVTVKATLEGYELPELQRDLGIKLTGIGETKEFTVDGLPHKFGSADEALSEKSSFIGLAVNRVRLKANENCDDFKGTHYSNYQLQGVYLCKPDERPGYNPDALLVVATYDRQAGTEFAAKDTVILYAYPFDSNIEDTDIDSEFISAGESDVRVITELHTYKTPEQFIESFKSGRYLSPTAGYTLEKIDFTE